MIDHNIKVRILWPTFFVITSKPSKSASFFFFSPHTLCRGSELGILWQSMDDDRDLKKRRLDQPSCVHASDWPNIPNGVSPEQLDQILISHDKPHDSSKIEWWYVNGHFDNGYSFFCAFFRANADDFATSNTPRRYAHAVNWALVNRNDPSPNAFRTFSFLDSDTPRFIRQLIDTGIFRGDKYIIQSLREVLEEGNVPLPDTLMDKPVTIGSGADLDLDFCGNRLQRQHGGPFRLTLRDKDGVALEAEVSPTKAGVLQGEKGVVSIGSKDDDMFYYFYPRCSMKGTLRVGSGCRAPVQGVAWYDHEFGGTIAQSREEFNAQVCNLVVQEQGLEKAWEWVALQLDNDTELSVTSLINPQTQQAAIKWAVLREKNEPAQRIADGIIFDFDPTSIWTSPTTGVPFPTRWHFCFTAPSGKRVDAHLSASSQAQEFVTLPGKPSYWEGFVGMTGTITDAEGTHPVTGRGFAECHGKKDLHQLDAAFAMLEGVCCAPVLSLIPQPLETMKEYETRAAPLIEASMAMLSMTGALPSGATPILLLAAAVYAALAREPQRLQEAQKYCSDRWSVVKKSCPCDFKRLVLRAFLLRVAKWDTEEEKPGGKTAELVEQQDWAALCVIPTEDYLLKPATAEDTQVAAKHFTGVWLLDRKNSQSIADVLAAEGVNLVIRTITARLVPTITTRVEGGNFVSDVRTTVSGETIFTPINGTEKEWPSGGRGLVKTRACLQRSGTVLYMRSLIPADYRGVEHKWLFSHRVPATGQTVFIEKMRFDYPPAAEGAPPPPPPVWCTRIFKPKV